MIDLNANVVDFVPIFIIQRYLVTLASFEGPKQLRFQSLEIISFLVLLVYPIFQGKLLNDKIKQAISHNAVSCPRLIHVHQNVKKFKASIPKLISRKIANVYLVNEKPEGIRKKLEEKLGVLSANPQASTSASPASTLASASALASTLQVGLLSAGSEVLEPLKLNKL